jgi:hypothetical protein
MIAAPEGHEMLLISTRGEMCDRSRLSDTDPRTSSISIDKQGHEELRMWIQER